MPLRLALLVFAFVFAAARAEENPYELPIAATARGPLDELVFAGLRARGLEPARPCSDAVFVRRVFLDVIGTLPTAAEARAFLADRAPGKRAALIDALLARPEYADYWAMHWSDTLRIKAEFPVNLWPNAAQAYHRWVYAALRDNLPYDRFARELLTANGSNFRVGPVNFFRALPSHEPEAIGQAVALTWLGVRSERWTDAQRAAFAMCFRALAYKGTGEWKEEIVFFDPARLPPGGRAAAIMPDGTVLWLDATHDPRAVFADWLVAPDNPWFARVGANRLWAALFGRGIVNEPDDFRPDNPPTQPKLLDFLAQEFARHGYDTKALLRLILNSQTYQLSSMPRGAADGAEACFACYPLRRLEAEVLIDALNQITGTSEKYSSAIPEPFTVMPDGQRAIALPDGSITSTFLEMFGRPARDTGLAAERNNRVTAMQRLHLLNSTQMQRKLDQTTALPVRGKLLRDAVDTLFLSILSRPPTADERALALAAGDGRDLAWALLNSAEFLHRH